MQVVSGNLDKPRVHFTAPPSTQVPREMASFFERFRNLLNQRQIGVVQRMFQEGIDGFKGGLSAGNYAIIAETSAATATRDLGDLVEQSALRKTGERKSTRYYLAIPEFVPQRATVTENGKVDWTASTTK